MKRPGNKRGSKMEKKNMGNDGGLSLNNHKISFLYCN